MRGALGKKKRKKVGTALRELKRRKAAGLIEITRDVLKTARREGVRELTHVMNERLGG